MKFVIVILIIFAVVFADDKYTTQYDNIDIDMLLKNDRLYTQYFQCLSLKKGCTPDGNVLKELIPDALKTDCEKCSDWQKKSAEKVINFMRVNKKEDFEQLLTIYDPEGLYGKSQLAKRINASKTN